MHSEAFIRQLTRPVTTVMLKPAKTSDIVAKPCNVIILFFYRIKLEYMIDIFGN